MFQLLEFTEAHVASVTNRVEKHGDDEKPAVTLRVEMTVANTVLDSIDPKIRQALYMPKPDSTPELPGVEESTPVLRCNSFESHTLPTCYEGWTLEVDDGIDDTKPMVFGGVKADKFTLDAKQGGSVVLGFRLGTSDVDADKLGKLAMHNGQSIWITLRAPEKKPDAIDGTKGHPGAAASGEPDATDLFAAGAEESGEDQDDVGGRVAEPERGENWPFPQKGEGADSAPPQRTTDEAPALVDRPSTKRTARGRERMKAELAKGQAEHDAAAQH